MSGNLLLDMSQAVVDGVELSEKQLQILIRVDALALRIYELGFAAGRRAGQLGTLEESIDEDDRRLGWKKAKRPPTA